MDTGIITNEGMFEPLPLFQIGPRLEGTVREAIKKDPVANFEFQLMKSQMKRFSPEVMYAIVKLGYKIVAPFAKSRDNVLFSNGGTLFVASKNYVCGKFFEPDKLKDEDGIQVPTDEVIKYDPELTNIDNIDEGIIDEYGYVDSTYLSNATKNNVGKGNLDLLASFLLMNDMLFSERIYKDVLTDRKKKTDLAYITSKPNCVCIKRDGDKFSLSYVSENTGKVEKFIDRLKEEDKIAKYEMLEVPPTDLAVQEENDLQVVEDTPRSLVA